MVVCTGGLLTRKALILAKAQTAAGTDPSPTPTEDAVLVSNPEFSIDPNILERDFVNPSISPFEHVVGRKLAQLTFTTELKGNGTENLGQVVTNEPKLARLLLGCGYLLSNASGLMSFTTDVASDDDFTITTEDGADHGFITGDGPVQFFANGGTLPTGVSEDTDYWIIRKDETSFAVATSRSNALAGTEVDITGDASGDVQIQTVRQVSRVNKDPANSSSEPSDLAFYRGLIEGASGPGNGVFEGKDSPVLYTIEVTTGGASGVAGITITGNNDDEDDLSGASEATVTSGTQFELGSSDVWITMEWTGDLVQGDKYRVLVCPDGIVALPTSDCTNILTFYFYEDGLLYKILDAQGTFTIDATAGNYATVEFTFTGQYVAPSDADLPTNEVFEDTLPQQVELGLLTFGSNVSLKVEQWTLDQANNVVPRPDINNSDGFSGVRISERNPSGGFDPEAELVATEDFWGDFANARAKVFTARVGTAVGNQIVLYGPKVQTNDISFADRDGIRVFDHGLMFRRQNGDDEVQFYFC